MYTAPIGGAINDCLAIVQSLRVLAGIENSFKKVGTSSWIQEIGLGINIRPEKALKPGSCQSNVKQLDTGDW